MAYADEQFDIGMEMYAKTQAMPATRERDALYKEPVFYFLNALKVHAAGGKR